MKLTAQVEELKNRADGLETMLEIEKSRSGATTESLPAGVHRPICTRISLGRFSGGIDTDDDGADDAVRLYLLTLDSRSRFILTVAKVRVTVAALPPGKDAITIATREFDAAQFDAAYRSGVAGTHYTLIVPLTSPAPTGVTELTVRIALDDLLTGQTHETESTVRYTRGQPTSAAAASPSP